MVQYHFRTKEGPSIGPIGADEFRQRLDAGDINDETQVWRSGMLDWTDYASLRASEERAQPPPLPTEPPPLLVTPATPLPAAKESHHAEPRPGVRFLACASCGQDWPENLLTAHGKDQICGNCIRKQGDNLKKTQLKNQKSSVSSGWGLWLLKTLGMGGICVAIIFGRLWLKSETRRGTKPLRYELNPKERTFRQVPPGEPSGSGKL